MPRVSWQPATCTACCNALSSTAILLARNDAPLDEAPEEYWYGGDATGHAGRPMMDQAETA